MYIEIQVRYPNEIDAVATLTYEGISFVYGETINEDIAWEEFCDFLVNAREQKSLTVTLGFPKYSEVIYRNKKVVRRPIRSAAGRLLVTYLETGIESILESLYEWLMKRNVQLV